MAFLGWEVLEAFSNLPLGPECSEQPPQAQGAMVSSAALNINQRDLLYPCVPSLSPPNDINTTLEKPEFSCPPVHPQYQEQAWEPSQHTANEGLTTTKCSR